MASSAGLHIDREPPDIIKLVYEPQGILPHLDIVLVHGLGRTSIDTWTKGGPHPSFWPDWLHEQGPLRMARIWMIGYDVANFSHNILHTPQARINAVINSLWDKLAKGVGSSIRLSVSKLILYSESIPRDTDTYCFRGTLDGWHRS